MPLFETVVLPLDGSPLDATALPYAVEVARLTGASVTVVHVLDEMRPVYDAQRGEVVWVSPESPRVELDAPELFAEAVGALRAAGTTVRVVFRLGEPAREIVAEVEQWPRPVVVLATHARSGLERLALGSVADEVVRHAAAPVLVVPVPSEPALSRTTRLRTVVVPLDGTPVAEQALPIATELARLAGATVVLVRVVEAAPMGGDEPEPPPSPLYRSLVEEFERRAQDAASALARTADDLAAREGIVVEWLVLRGEPDEALRDLLTHQAPDLVVMTTHGRHGIARWLFGSIAERLLTTRRVPLLLLRAS